MDNFLLEVRRMPSVETVPPQHLAGVRVEHPPLLVTTEGRTIRTVHEWEVRRAAIEADWRTYLGQPPYAAPPLSARVEAEYDFGTYTARLLRVPMEPGYAETCYLMVPKERRAEWLPAVIVFYYDVDTPAGHNLGSPRWQEGNEVRRFARHLVERGYVAMVQRWAFEGFLEAEGVDPEQTDLASRYAPAVARQRRIAPQQKGMGRVVWDAARIVDYVSGLDFVDPQRIACMGHSLGGKMALYAAAFDRRIAAAIGSDLGIGLSFSNWDAPWYLGPEVREPDFPRDHHQLLALIAPRPFLLIAGEDADGERSWPYLNAAREVYALYGAEERLGMCNHGTGHTPTWDALKAAYAWLDAQLGWEPAGQGAANAESAGG